MLKRASRLLAVLALLICDPVSGGTSVLFSETFEGRELAVWVPFEEGSPVIRPFPVILVFPGGTQTIERMQSFVCPSGEPGIDPETGAPLDPDCLHHVAAETDPPHAVVYVSGTWDGVHLLSHTFDAGRCCGYAREQDADDVGFVDALLAWLEARYGHDPTRVFATGMSNGSMLAHRLGCELTERVTAFAAVAGGIGLEDFFPRCGPGVPEPCDAAPLHPETAFLDCEPGRTVPWMMVHGTADENQPWEGGGEGISGTYFIGIPDTLEVWLEAGGCDPGLEPLVVEMDDSVDETELGESVDTTVTRIEHDCREPGDRAGPLVYRVNGGGHSWPGGKSRLFTENPTNYDISAAREMLRFFVRVGSADDGVSPDECPGGFVRDAETPGFCVRVEITPRGGSPLTGAKMDACLPETLCFRGAVSGRAEVFVRIVGPKPNGNLWPTLVKFTTSEVDVWIFQRATGEERHYTLRGASPGFDELPGLFDRFGFEP